MKRIAAAAMVVGLCSGAHAMEALPDDALSDSVGQSGLSVDVSPVSVSAQHLRFYDSDGFSGLPYGASVDVANFALTTTSSTLVHLDVGSNGAGSSATTSLFLAIGPISGMSVTTGNISTDGGNELASASPVVNFATFSATGINISGIDLMITPGGAHSSSGMTFTTLAPITMSASLAVTDVANGGVFSTQLGVNDLLVGGATVDVMGTGQGVELGAGQSTMSSMSLTDVRVTPTAFSGASMGSVNMYGMSFTGTTVSVSGH